MPHSKRSNNGDESGKLIRECEKTNRLCLRFDQMKSSGDMKAKSKTYRYHAHMIRLLGNCKGCIRQAKHYKGIVVSDDEMNHCYMLCDECMKKFINYQEIVSTESELSTFSEKLKIC